MESGWSDHTAGPVRHLDSFLLLVGNTPRREECGAVGTVLQATYDSLAKSFYSKPTQNVVLPEFLGPLWRRFIPHIMVGFR
jgi:hypothetical protein